MNTTDYIGFAAAFCTTMAFMPQAIKVLKTKNTQSLSLTMYLIFTIGVGLWLAYGWLKHDMAMIIANIITLIFAIAILYNIIRNTFNKAKNNK